jgi:uncharacterized membrane protein YjjP (DUF1212 family)
MKLNLFTGVLPRAQGLDMTRPMQNTPPLPAKDLERIALVALEAARVLLESGSRAKVVHQCGRRVVEGLGAEYLGSRTGYASLALTVASGELTRTRMIAVPHHGVNHRLDHAVRRLAVRIERDHLSIADVETELARIKTETPRHAPWFVALAVGLACAAFGRLLGMDWASFAPVFAAGALGQYGRHLLLKRGLNVFVNAAFIAFAASLIGGIGARLLGSQTVPLAMMASILLLVPGVPATNAQADIMDGYPTMGSARAVTVLMIMVFATAGIWAAQSLLGVRL